MKMYTRFGLMILVSTVVMYALMYADVLQWDHVFFSQTRLYMALLMGGAMAVVMMAFMWGMYSNRRAKAAIVIVGIVVAAGATWLARSQATVDDVAYMRAMIPHHSIAILTSERAGIRDPRVRKLADGIIASQRREIGEMKGLIEDMEHAR